MKLTQCLLQSTFILSYSCTNDKGNYNGYVRLFKPILNEEKTMESYKQMNQFWNITGYFALCI